MPAKSHPPIVIAWNRALAVKIGQGLLRFSLKLALWLLRMIPSFAGLYGAWIYLTQPPIHGLFYLAVAAVLAIIFRMWRAALRLVTDLMVRR